MIAINHLNFTYADSTKGLFDLDLQIKPNECVALIGQSGNGKTTLTRVINGLSPVHYKGNLTGSLQLDGTDTTTLPLWQRSKLVGSVFQDPKSQFFSSELHGEIAFSMENFGFDQATIRQITDQIIQSQQLDHLQHTALDCLSSGEKQKVAISSVLTLRPPILVFDEPSANLDEPSARALGKMMRQLKDSGHTLVIAEHRLSYIAPFVDRYLYLEDGKIIQSFTTASLSALSDTERLALGIRSVLPVERKPLKPLCFCRDDDFVVENLSYTIKGKPLIQNLSFSANNGSIVAITGKNGVGKTTLAKLLCGLAKHKQGKVSIDGKVVKSAHRYRDIWYSANDTNTQFFTNSLTEELLLLTEKTEENLQKARDILRQIQLYEYKDNHPQTLSGGQKQRLSIACGLLSDRKVLLFDEPTSGLDGKNLQIVSTLFQSMMGSNKLIFIISHDNELINACCTYQLQLGGV